jgi:hypothetical protein
MKHARSDYDCIQPWPTKRPHYALNPVTGEKELYDKSVSGDDVEPIIPDDEPVFLIRGQDLAAVPAAEAWCEAAKALGADPRIIETVRRHIETVRVYQAQHGAKVPDAPAEALPV